MESAEPSQVPLKGAPESFIASIDGIADLEPDDKELLRFYVDNVFYGDPDLRVYGFESYVEKAGKDKAIELQRRFIVELSERERYQLIERIPKGMRIELEIEKYWNGNSPCATEQIREIVERFELLLPGSVEALPEDIESTMKLDEDETEKLLANSKKLSGEEAKELIDQWFPIGERVRNIVCGTVQAEPIQGYGGLRLITEEGGIVSEGAKDITSFVLTGVDKEQAKRRPREIYHDRRVKVLGPYTNTWQEGAIEDRLLADQLRVKLDRPILIPTILNIDKEVGFVDVWVGKPPDYEPTKKLPEVGSASIENEYWLYETIQFDLEAQTTTLERVPVVFRPGKLVQFPDGIFEVSRVSSQGMVEVKDISSPPVGDWKTLNWIGLDELPQTLTDEELAPEIIEAANSIRGARVKVNTKDFGYPAEKSEDVIISVRGVYNINGSPKVLLQALPVWLGRKGNIPEFSYKVLEWSDFDKLRDEGTIKVSEPDITKELKERFPDRFKDILRYLDEYDGTVPCNLRLKDGRTNNGHVSFSSLPYGIWNVWEPAGRPELIPLEEVEDIEPYDFWAQFD